MKRYIVLAAAVLAASMFPSCVKDGNLVEKENVSEGVVLKAYVDDNIKDLTKTSLVGGTDIQWSASDAITVFADETASGRYHSTATSVAEGGKKAEFTIGGASAEEIFFLALYPKNESATMNNSLVVTTTLPATQKAVAGSFADGANVALANAENGISGMQFYNGGALVSVKVNNDNIKKLELSASGDYAYMAGPCNLNFAGSGDNLSFVCQSTYEEKIESVALEGDFVSGQTYYFVLLPGIYENPRLKITNSHGQSVTLKNSTTLELKSNDNYFIADLPDLSAAFAKQPLVENFTSSAATSNKVGDGNGFTTAKITDDFDYVWTSTGSVYVFKDGIRLGTGSATGSVSNSTMLSGISSETFTVKVYAAGWNTDGGKLVVTYNGEPKQESPANASISSPSTTVYSANLFTKPTEFVFTKAADVNSFTIASSSKRIIIDKVEVVPGGVLPADFSVSTTNLAAAWDETSKTFNITASDEVAWEIVADDGLTLSQDEGNGNATITVSFAENTEETPLRKEILVATDYSPLTGDSEYTIVLTQAGKPSRQMDGNGTAANPYSVADALYLTNILDNNEVSAEACYIAGDICEVKSYYSTGKSINYYIGTETENIYVYGGRDLGDGNFSSANDLKVGDKLVVYGKFQKYVKDEVVTPEIVDSYLYSYNGATSILTGITLGEKKTSYMQNDEFVKPAVTASYKGKENAVVTDATTFSGYNMAAVGTQTVTASYTEGGITKTATYSITVADNTDYTITTNYDSSMGSVSVKVNNADAVTAKANQSVAVKVTPNEGYMVKSFKVDNVAKNLSNGSYSFKMPASNVVIDVDFDVKQTEVTASQTSFSSTSGSLGDDLNISYKAEKGNGTTNPAINSNKIRLYKPSSGNSTGGVLTLTANNGAKITSVKVTSNRNNGFNVAADGSSVTASTSGSTVYTVSDLNASVVTFTNKYNDSHDISSIVVTYYGGSQPEPEQLIMSAVTVDSKTSSSIKFKWDAVANATGYKVKVGNGSYGDTQAGTTYTVSDLAPETEVTVYVYAVGDGGLNLDSDPKSCTAKTNKEGSTTATYTALFGSTYNSQGVSAYNASWSATNNGFTVNLANWNNNNSGWAYIKAGHKNTAYVATITTAAAIPEAITKIKVTIDAITANNINSIKLYMGDSASSCTTEVATIDKSTGEKSVTIPSPAENKFYKLSFDCKAAANGSVQVSKVVYTNAE